MAATQDVGPLLIDQRIGKKDYSKDCFFFKHWQATSFCIVNACIAGMIALSIVFILRDDTGHGSPKYPEGFVPQVALSNAASSTSKMPVIGLGVGGYSTSLNTSSGYTPKRWNVSTGYKYATEWLQLWSDVGNEEGIIRIDSSLSDESQPGIAQAILDYTDDYTTIARDKIFITCKAGLVYGMGYNETMKEIDDILDVFQTDYIDLLLIHWPATSVPNIDDKYCNASDVINYSPSDCRKSTWKAYETLYKNGKAKAIGVSNFFIKHLNDTFYWNGGIHRHDSSLNIRYYPAVNQIEFHGYFHNNDVVQYCVDRGIVVNGYSTLGAPDRTIGAWNTILTQHPFAKDIANKYNKSIAQIWQKWSLQQDILLNVRSSSYEHQLDNIDIFDFELTLQEILHLASIQDIPKDPNTNNDPNNLP